MSILFRVAAFTFFVFILWIVYLANTGQNSIFFNFVSEIPYGDKIGHLMIFGVLTLLMNLALNFKSFRFLGCNMFVGGILVLCFAIIEELSQFFLLTRTLDIFDLVADGVGVSLFSGVSYLICRARAS